jgi:hypothetical protein
MLKTLTHIKVIYRQGAYCCFGRHTAGAKHSPKRVGELIGTS